MTTGRINQVAAVSSAGSGSAAAGDGAHPNAHASLVQRPEREFFVEPSEKLDPKLVLETRFANRSPPMRANRR